MTDRRRLGAVGHQDEGHTGFFCELTKQAEDVGSVSRIKIAGRLIRQQQRRAMSQRPGNRDPLTLTAGQFGRKGLPSMRHSDAFEKTVDPLHPPVDRLSDQLKRQFDVLKCIQRGQEVEELENGANPMTPELRQPVAIKGLEGEVTDANAPGIRSIHAPKTVEQSRLPTAGWPCQCEALSR